MNYRFATVSRRKQKIKTEKYDGSYSNFSKREKKKKKPKTILKVVFLFTSRSINMCNSAKFVLIIAKRRCYFDSISFVYALF